MNAPLPKLVAQATEQGAVVSLAHPELGEGMSVTEGEIEELVSLGLPFGIEVHNGGAAQVDFWRPYIEARKHRWPFSKIESLLPRSGSNSKAKEIFRYLRTNIATGGSDSHGLDTGSVVTCFPAEEATVFDAMQNGTSVIMAQRAFPRPPLYTLVVGTVGGKVSALRRNSKENLHVAA